VEDVDFVPPAQERILIWFTKVCENKGFHLNELNLIFCSDSYLLEMNRRYLNHDYFTDIITFDYVDNQNVSGDLFISIERVRENAQMLNISFEDELDRVMVHGLLHLVGYQDNTKSKQAEIKAQEDFCLTLRSQI
jgi:rRNA maturation RNase YbeY